MNTYRDGSPRSIINTTPASDKAEVRMMRPQLYDMNTRFASAGRYASEIESGFQARITAATTADECIALLNEMHAARN